MVVRWKLDAGSIFVSGCGKDTISMRLSDKLRVGKRTWVRVIGQRDEAESRYKVKGYAGQREDLFLSRLSSVMEPVDAPLCQTSGVQRREGQARHRAAEIRWARLPSMGVGKTVRGGTVGKTRIGCVGCGRLDRRESIVEPLQVLLGG